VQLHLSPQYRARAVRAVALVDVADRGAVFHCQMFADGDCKARSAVVSPHPRTVAWRRPGRTLCDDAASWFYT
jgi:hypothetical protein